MTDFSARFALPLLQPGQAQKEMFHNEALALLDAALHAVAESLGDNAPPASPAIGQCWIVGSAPAGEWTGRAGMLAAWTSGGWRFVAPVPGMTVWLRAARMWALYDAGAWGAGVLPATTVRVGGQQVVGARAGAIASPAGGTVIDAEARARISAILIALRGHGLIAP